MFLKVMLPKSNTMIESVIEYNSIDYRMDVISGSGIKEKEPFVYAVENNVCAGLLSLLNFKEAIAYSQRALLPSAQQNLTGHFRINCLSENDAHRHITLKNGLVLNVCDGWGLIKKSILEIIPPTPITKEKQKPRNKEWFTPA